MPPSTAQAGTVAVLAASCLDYLVANPEELMGFMTQAGYDPDGLRRAIGTPALEHGLLDHFATNESLLLAMCANAGISPEAFMSSWHRLNPGA